MRLLERVSWVADTVRDELWLLRHLGVGRTDFVLDVGSGASPWLRSNVLCDKFVGDASERHGRTLVHDRPLVLGDAERLPFADRSFDYVVCSHVLEHLADPASAIAELERVAPRGYIETPSAAWEAVAGFPFHRWRVSLEGGRLVFERKPAPLVDERLRAWFVGMQRSLKIERQIWFARRRVAIYTCLAWESEIPFEIRGDGEEVSFAGARLDAQSVSAEAVRMGPAARAIAWYGRRLRRESDRPWFDVERLLRCPSCRGDLLLDRGDRYRCKACSALYPREHGVPRLLKA